MNAQKENQTQERVVVTGLNNKHYLEIRRLIESGQGLPPSLYSESHVGPNGEQRPIRVNRASFSVYQG